MSQKAASPSSSNKAESAGERKRQKEQKKVEPTKSASSSSPIKERPSPGHVNSLAVPTKSKSTNKSGGGDGRGQKAAPPSAFVATSKPNDNNTEGSISQKKPLSSPNNSPSSSPPRRKLGEQPKQNSESVAASRQSAKSTSPSVVGRRKDQPSSPNDVTADAAAAAKKKVQMAPTASGAAGGSQEVRTDKAGRATERRGGELPPSVSVTSSSSTPPPDASKTKASSSHQRRAQSNEKARGGASDERDNNSPSGARRQALSPPVSTATGTAPSSSSSTAVTGMTSGGVDKQGKTTAATTNSFVAALEKIDRGGGGGKKREETVAQRETAGSKAKNSSLLSPQTPYVATVPATSASLSSSPLADPTPTSSKKAPTSPAGTFNAESLHAVSSGGGGLASNTKTRSASVASLGVTSSPFGVNNGSNSNFLSMTSRNSFANAASTSFARRRSASRGKKDRDVEDLSMLRKVIVWGSTDGVQPSTVFSHAGVGGGGGFGGGGTIGASAAYLTYGGATGSSAAQPSSSPMVGGGVGLSNTTTAAGSVGGGASSESAMRAQIAALNPFALLEEYKQKKLTAASDSNVNTNPLPLDVGGGGGGQGDERIFGKALSGVVPYTPPLFPNGSSFNTIKSRFIDASFRPPLPSSSTSGSPSSRPSASSPSVVAASRRGQSLPPSSPLFGSSTNSGVGIGNSGSQSGAAPPSSPSSAETYFQLAIAAPMCAAATSSALSAGAHADPLATSVVAAGGALSFGPMVPITVTGGGGLAGRTSSFSGSVSATSPSMAKGGSLVDLMGASTTAGNGSPTSSTLNNTVKESKKEKAERDKSLQMFYLEAMNTSDRLAAPTALHELRFSSSAFNLAKHIPFCTAAARAAYAHCITYADDIELLLSGLESTDQNDKTTVPRGMARCGLFGLAEIDLEDLRSLVLANNTTWANEAKLIRRQVIECAIRQIVFRRFLRGKAREAAHALRNAEREQRQAMRTAEREKRKQAARERRRLRQQQRRVRADEDSVEDLLLLDNRGGGGGGGGKDRGRSTNNNGRQSKVRFARSEGAFRGDGNQTIILSDDEDDDEYNDELDDEGADDSALLQADADDTDADDEDERSLIEEQIDSEPLTEAEIIGEVVRLILLQSLVAFHPEQVRHVGHQVRALLGKKGFHHSADQYRNHVQSKINSYKFPSDVPERGAKGDGGAAAASSSSTTSPYSFSEPFEVNDSNGQTRTFYDNHEFGIQKYPIPDPVEVLASPMVSAIDTCLQEVYNVYQRLPRLYEAELVFKKDLRTRLLVYAAMKQSTTNASHLFSLPAESHVMMTDYTPARIDELLMKYAGLEERFESLLYSKYGPPINPIDLFADWHKAVNNNNMNNNGSAERARRRRSSAAAASAGAFNNINRRQSLKNSPLRQSSLSPSPSPSSSPSLSPTRDKTNNHIRRKGTVFDSPDELSLSGLGLAGRVGRGSSHQVEEDDDDEGALAINMGRRGGGLFSRDNAGIDNGGKGNGDDEKSRGEGQVSDAIASARKIAQRLTPEQLRLHAVASSALSTYEALKAKEEAERAAAEEEDRRREQERVANLRTLFDDLEESYAHEDYVKLLQSLGVRRHPPAAAEEISPDDLLLL